MVKPYKLAIMLLLLSTLSIGVASAAGEIPSIMVETLQQNGVCMGVVKDANDVIIGASVLVKGTTNGTITDIGTTYNYDSNEVVIDLKAGEIEEIDSKM